MKLHKIECTLTDEQLGLLCEVLAERHHKLHLRTLDMKSSSLKYEEEVNPRSSKILICADIDANRQLDICSSLIAEIESKL